MFLGSSSDMPNLWKPRRENYFPIDVLPTLGSGKLDLKKMKELAKEAVAHRPGWFKRMAERLHHAMEHHHEEEDGQATLGLGIGRETEAP